MAATDVWSDPNRCPFCGAGLRSPGAGFIDHVEETSDCASQFERWRDHVADDIQGDWSG